MSAGTALHAINYVFRASGVGSNGSDFAFSGNIGASLYSPSFRLALSINDFNQPSLRPIDAASIVYRYYTFHVSKSIELGSQIKLQGSTRSNIIFQGYSTTLLHLGLIYKNVAGLNAYAHSAQGWGVSLDFTHLEVEAGWLDLSLGYRVPYPNGNRIPYNTLEINLGYSWERNNEQKGQ